MLSKDIHCCCDTNPGGGTRFLRRDVNNAKLPAATPSAARAKILFVDDDPSLLATMKIVMRKLTGRWESVFAESGEQGLALIQKQPFDVIVTDMRMPGMNGVQLLNHAQRLHPQTVRIILSGYSDLRDVVSCVGLTHQFLAKPCSLEDLQNCLKKVTSIKQQLGNEKLREITGGMANLPTLPELYLAITDVLQSPSSSIQSIAEIAGKDLALSAKLLQLSNSAFFGFSHKIFSVSEAVQLLGLGIIQSLALAVPLFSSFDQKKCPSFCIEQLWQHSAETAAIGRQISVRHHADGYLSEHAFAAGILHDVGKLILADRLPEQYEEIIKEAQATGTPLVDVERKHLQATHGEVGGYLLALWGLPVPLVEAVACHHNPKRCDNNGLCLAGVVHIADALQHELSARPDKTLTPVDAAYLKHIGLTQEYENWRRELREKAAAGR
jgi:HD-like signal output (HDOD) protein/CheY-like chemotaxis protein